MTIELSTGQIALLLTVFSTVGPSIYFVGRFSKRLDVVEKTQTDRAPLVERFLQTEQLVKIVAAGQEDILRELKRIVTTVDQYVGRADAAEERRVRLETREH